MKAKTQKKLERAVVIILVLVFILGTLLLYLPVGNQATPPTAAPVQPGVQASVQVDGGTATGQPAP
jgi:hypothetical protein